MTTALSSLTAATPLPEELSRDYLEFNRVLPLAVDPESVRVACEGEPAGHVIQDLMSLYARPVELVIVDADALSDAIRRGTTSAETVVELIRDLSGEPSIGGDTEQAALADVRDLVRQPPVVRFVSLLVREAADAGASDIHLDSGRDGLRVRFRVDGVLSEIPGPPRALQAAVVSRIKLLAELDIADRWTAQDGRLRIRLESREMDMRVATVPTMFGETVTIRLLDRGGRPATLDALGMETDTLAAAESLARRPHGIVLVTGPTGSGKTTTLYAALGLRDLSAEKILTVEDPIEYELPGVTQIAVDQQRGMTFGRALKAMVRHDPDVLMVGEMRDEESADVAVRAAMTGHLVFSTLHTNDALGAIPRLLDLKIPGYLAAATIEGIIAQRLVRRICEGCRETASASRDAITMMCADADRPMDLWRGAGCTACRGTGYRGRAGIFELLTFDDEVRSAIAGGMDRVSLPELAAVKRMRTLKQDGWNKVRSGVTTIEEVLRVVQ